MYNKLTDEEIRIVEGGERTIYVDFGKLLNYIKLINNC